jgi:uncharacterized membrane protein
MLYISNIKLVKYNIMLKINNYSMEVKQMDTKKISKERKSKGDRIKAVFILLLTVSVAGVLFIYAFNSGNLNYSIILILLAAILLVFFGLFALRRYKDAKEGMPFEDERSKRVMEKAASKSFYVSLYVLLAIGWLSEDKIQFRDVSQASSAMIGVMAILFFAFWAYYNRKEL